MKTALQQSATRFSVRSEADSNRCTRFCRPLPRHSAIRPLLSHFPSLTQGERTNCRPFGIANIRIILIFAKLTYKIRTNCPKLSRNILRHSDSPQQPAPGRERILPGKRVSIQRQLYTTLPSSVSHDYICAG